VAGPGADVDLDVALVERLVAEQLPALAGAPVAHLATGWDHAVFTVGDQWLLRLPRREERVAWLTREVALLELLAPVLAGRVPCVALHGAPSATFPYPFLCYRRLAGVPAVDASPMLARDLGELLGRLHGVDTSSLPATPDGWELEAHGAADLRLAATVDPARRAVLDALGRVPGLSLDAQAQPYLDGAVVSPTAAARLRLAHNDLCDEHVLVDPDGRLVGVVDLTDAMVTDPAVDFAGLVTIGPPSFVAAAVAAYPLERDEGFVERIGHRARVATLTWLVEAIEAGEAVDRHVAWVARAFALEGGRPGA
jgi:aminoglycoside phosphotransferase (APT) family kinase protein